MSAIVLEEKINWTSSLLQNDLGSRKCAPMKEGITLKRNLIDDTFSLESYSKVVGGNETFSVNNKGTSGGIDVKQTGPSDLYTAHRNSIDNITLAKTTQFSVADWDANVLIYSVNVFPEILSMNKNITLKKGDYLELRSVNSVTFEEPEVGIGTSQSRIDLTPVIKYNTTYIVPKPFSSVVGNKTLFDIYTKNDDNQSTFADYSKEDGKVTASSLLKSGLKTHFQPVLQGAQEVILHAAKKVGSVEIFDNQFYDYKSKKVETGYGKYAEQGLLVPYDFSGEFKEQVSFTPNAAFKDLNINMTYDVDQPLLNKYDGKVILNIDEVDEKAGPYKIISTDKIKLLADNDPSIKGLERISYEENL